MTHKQKAIEVLDEQGGTYPRALVDAIAKALREERRSTLRWAATELENRMQRGVVTGALRNAIAHIRKAGEMGDE